MKYIFITGWVISGIGKGITAASIGTILKNSGLRINAIKLDPYLQVDAGTMSPYEHGETFVTADWFETDLDLGHYERFLDVELDHNSSITTGRIYQDIITAERRGDFLGKTVQVVPHVTNYIKQLIRFHELNNNDQQSEYDITIVEIWGTIGDIEGPHFIEAIRQMRKDVGVDNTMYVHVVPLFYLQVTQELKTKPIQHSVKELSRLGIHPDIIVCRTSHEMSSEIKSKISLFCDVDEDCVFEWRDVSTIYDVPNKLMDQGIDQIIHRKLKLAQLQPDLTIWNQQVWRILIPRHQMVIGIAGKYSELCDAYISVVEALRHAGARLDTHIQIERIATDEITSINQVAALITQKNISWIVVPWWFGYRGVEGKILIAQYCRENSLPYLWLCLWLQVAIIEYARNVAMLWAAHSTEFIVDCEHPLITYLAGQSDDSHKWWTMRLWNYHTIIAPSSKIWQLYQQHSRVSHEYGERIITERHRHRYEVNPHYVQTLKEVGLIIAGTDRESWLVECIELADHPYFVATQAHPEFTSRLERPHPLFVGLIQSAKNPDQSQD